MCLLKMLQHLIIRSGSTFVPSWPCTSTTLALPESESKIGPFSTILKAKIQTVILTKWHHLPRTLLLSRFSKMSTRTLDLHYMARIRLFSIFKIVLKPWNLYSLSILVLPEKSLRQSQYDYKRSQIKWLLCKSQAPAELRFCFRYSGKGREAVSKLCMTDCIVEDFVAKIDREILYDHKVEDRRVTHWTHIKFSGFRLAYSTEEKAAHRCIESLNELRQDLRPHMLYSERLLSRIKHVLCLLSWCEMLFQRLSIHEDTPEIFLRTQFMPPPKKTFAASERKQNCTGYTTPRCSKSIRIIEIEPNLLIDLMSS